MSPDDQTIQLDLTTSITEVPQANSISLFISLMEALRGEEHTLGTLAELLEVDERTVRYYAEFGQWLQWIEPTGDAKFGLTTTGRAFVESEPGRGRLFANALFERPLVKTAQRIKREQLEEVDEPEATRRACQRAIEGLTTLSEATIRRRAQALASMLRWAYNPGGLDWSTGRPDTSPQSPFSFQGQSFLTAYAARQFTASDRLHIGFPRQVVTFAAGQTTRLDQKRWNRASYELDDGSGRWFGSIPVNESTRNAAARGGPDLRRLLIACNPYLAMLMTLLTSPSAARSAATRLTRDMYGLRLWYHNRELGTPLATLADIATELKLVPVETVPHLTEDPGNEQLHPAEESELAELLVDTGMVRPVDTVLILAPGVASELRLPLGDSPTLWERMEPLREDIHDVIRARLSA